MSVFHENMLIGASGQAPAATGISRSLRFNSSDSAYLSRTPASAGDRKKWTVSFWTKLCAIPGTYTILFGAGAGGSDSALIRLNYESSGKLNLAAWNTDPIIRTASVYRDFSAWYHIVVSVDTANGTASNRAKIYVNGVEATYDSDSRSSYSSVDTPWNNNVAHTIGTGSWSGGSTLYSNFYLADFYNIDGQALDPSSFTETDATTGQLIPKAYTGSYGTNGFHLDFADNASTTTIGYDAAGSNDWTANNLSVTAGAGNDSLVDVPTNGGQTDTGVGGEVRGNYCTWNPLAKTSGVTLSNGNLDAVSTTQNQFLLATMYASTGKWYAEFTCNSAGTEEAIGIATSRYMVSEGFYSANKLAVFRNGGNLVSSVFGSALFSSYTTGDIVRIKLDLDNQKFAVAINGGSFSEITITSYDSHVAGELWTFHVFNGTTSGSGSFNTTANFGQRPFAYTAPSGFKALCTANLPAPLITKPSTVFDVKLYTGNGSTQTISGLGFSPDLVWIKARSTSAYNHFLLDTVRGVNNELNSNTTDSEYTRPAPGSLTAFNSDGFALNTATGVNANSVTYASWAWDAGSSTVTNTQGSITTTVNVRANATAGFSIVTYTGTGTNCTVGHGLGVAPEMIIVKDRDAAKNWAVYHKSLSSSAHYLLLNLTDAQANTFPYWNGAPTSTTFTLGTTGGSNENGDKFVAYCFAPVVGYSSFGSYTGNGSTDGPFVYTGFRPAWILTKRTDTSGQHWGIFDFRREGYNSANDELLANLSAAEASTLPMDILSNGFKIRNTAPDANGSGGTFIYAAFAESPFQYARAR